MVLVVCFIIIPLTYLTQPQVVEATCTPIHIKIPPNPLAVLTDGSLDPSKIFQDFQQSTNFFKNCVLDGLATVVAKQIIKSLTASIVQWINSGFKGNPSFVQNSGKFFGGIADSVGGNIIENIAPFLCSPFRLNLQLALALSMSSSQQQEIGCTLTDVQNNVSNFAKGAGGGGSGGINGWNDWFQMTQTAQNNPYGAAMIASAQLNIGIETAQGKYQQQLDWGKGFLSYESCPQIDGAAQAATDAGQSDMQNAESASAAVGPIQDAFQKSKMFNQNNEPVYGVSPTNNGCVTQTPGAVIESQLNNVLPSDLHGLEIAQSIDQIFAALVGQLLSQTLGGIGGLSGAGKQSSSGSNGGNNFNYQNSLGGVKMPDIPISGSCTPSKQNAAVNEQVKWNVYVTALNGNVTYSWSGDDGLSGSTATVPFTYTTPGTKSATVRVSTNGDNPQWAQINCVPGVVIGDNSPTSAPAPSISCAASQSSVSINTPVTWQAIAVGGVPPFTYTWEGSDNFTASGQQATQTYATSGLKTATVSLTDAAGNTYVNPCNSTVNVTP